MQRQCLELGIGLSLAQPLTIQASNPILWELESCCAHVQLPAGRELLEAEEVVPPRFTVAMPCS